MATADIELFDIDADPGAWANAIAGLEQANCYDFDLDKDYGIAGFPGPLSSAGGGPVSAGIVPDKISMDVSGAPVNTLVAVGPSAGFGNASNAILANTFVDSFLIWLEGDKVAFEFNGLTLLGGSTIDISVTDQNNNVTVFLDVTVNSGRNLGLLGTNGQTIAHVELLDFLGGAEGVQGFGTTYVARGGGGVGCDGGPVTGACCLADDTCVDGVTQSECEDEPTKGGCGDCGDPGPPMTPGCSDQTCQDIVCAIDPFCCDTQWDGICAGEAQDLCDCDGGGGGLGGVYQGDDTVCADVNCGGPATGGCCQCDGDEQFCTVETEDDCAALGGEYLGNGSGCEAGGEQVVVTSSPNTAIPDANPAGASDTINMGQSFTVLDLEVQVNITHTWVGDLCVTLSKDGGEEVVLIQRIDDPGLGCDGGCCACSANNMNVTLDDQAGSPIGNQCQANLMGTFIPQESLAGFNNGDSAGAWTLHIVDNAAGDVGNLVDWSLIFTAPAAGGTPCEDAGHECITNEAPDCSAAFASSGQLWPPNHAYHDITVEGVTDPDGDPVTITITGIFQDESVNGTGDGNTCPDGTGVGSSTASVRAERSGQGDGRVYHISYLAEDGQGGECEGTVTVCVPHSQGQGGGCVDQGPLFDSTDCSDAGGAAGSTDGGRGSRRNTADNH